METPSSETTTAKDPRQVIWLSMYDVYYDAAYNEIVAEMLISRWQCIDEWTKVIVAVTASSSAVTGWTLWSQPGYATIWASLAGLAAILSIVHAALSVADRLRNASEVKRCFASLKNDVQIYRQKMRVNPEFSVDDFSAQQWEFMRRFGDCEQRIDNDILRTSRLKLRAQDRLDAYVEAERKSYGS